MCVTMNAHLLYATVRRGDLPELQTLITEAPSLMEWGGAANYRPLLVASENGHAEMVEWLLDQGAERDAQDVWGKDSLLWLAVKVTQQ